MRKYVLTGLTVATTLGVLVTPLGSYAFGLGKLELMSALNQPLKAEIDVTALQSDERDNLHVTLASTEEFQKAGLDRNILLTQLNFDVVERGAQTKLLVTSKHAIKEPFLNFLLTATAGSGQLLREYTVLLDPPEYFTANTNSRKQNTTTSSVPAPTQQTRSAAPVTRYGPVKPTDTLWNIASSTAPASDISVQQMMLAILNANPVAFVNNNVNGLKAGYNLQIPAESTIRAVSKNDAIAAFNEQNTAWSTLISANSSGIAEATEAQADIVPDKANEQSDVVAAPVPDFEDNATETTAPIDDDSRLKLVAPEDDVNNEDDANPNVSGDDELSKLTQQLTLAQETIEAQTQENIDFKARMDAMEEQMETMRRLISLKDADLARLQDLLEEEPELTADDALAEIEAETTPQLNSTDETKDDEFNLQENEQTIADSTAQTDESDTQTMDAISVEVSDDTAVASESALTEPVKMVEQPLTTQGHILAFMTKLKQFIVSNTWSVVAFVLFILLLLLVFLRRRGQDEIIDEEQVLDVAPAATQIPLNGESSSLTDAPLDEPEEQKSVDELLEQADMFVGYADYIQARQALVLARELEPANMLVAYKLLFVLYKQKQAEQFLLVVEDNGFDDQYDAWEEIRGWGHELMPENPLFFAATSLSETIISADEDDENILAAADDDTTAPRSFGTVEFDTTPVEPEAPSAPSEFDDEDRLEFNLSDDTEMDINDPQSETVEFTSELTDSDDDLLEFDANEYSSETLYEDDDSVELQESSENDSLADELMAFNIDEIDTTLPIEDASLDMDEIDTTLPGDDEPFEIDDLSVPDLEFDVDELDEMDEAETKIELAQAYVDMGDAEGAKSILTEVLATGTADQQARAQDLLHKL